MADRTDTSREALQENVALTLAELALKSREAVLAGNAHVAIDWASAMREAAAAYRDLEDNA